MTDYTDLLEKLEFFGAGEGTRAEVCKRARDAIEQLEAERDALREERAQILRREEEAWRRANHAEARVRGWEATLVVADLPQRFAPVQGWGPGEGDAVSVPQITPERLTSILDRLAKAEAALTAKP